MITRSHILSMEVMTSDNIKINLKFNEYGDSINYIKKELSAKCPITLKPIVNPIMCVGCCNSFEDNDKFKELSMCPLCKSIQNNMFYVILIRYGCDIAPFDLYTSFFRQITIDSNLL